MARGGDSCDFESWALELFRLQFASNPTYSRFCRAEGRLLETVRHWREIPAVPTAAFKEWEVTSLPPSSRTAVFHSSGTTASRQSRHFHGPESLALYEASARAWFLRHIPPTEAPGVRDWRVWSLTPPPAAVPHSSLVHMFARAGGWLGATTTEFLGRVNPAGEWSLEMERWWAALKEAQRLQRPVLLLGTAFLFVHLLDALASASDQGLLPEGSIVLETGGYKGRSRTIPRDELHESMSRAFGIPVSRIVGEYGMSELSSQAYSVLEPNPGQAGTRNANRPVVRQYRFPPWVRIAIISPETGREVPEGTLGLLRVWDLANVWSVMGIQTEDLATAVSGAFELHGRSPAASPRGCSLMAA